MKKKTFLFFLLPSFIGFVSLFVIPFFVSFSYSFTDNIFTGHFAGFSTYKEILQNEFLLLALKNTGLFSLASVPLILIYSLFVSLLISRFFPKAPFIQTAFFLPVVLPSATVTVLWQAYFSDYTPFTSLLLIYIWKYSGLNIMLFLHCLAGAKKEPIESAKLDGAGSLRIFISIILPDMLPVLFFTFILSLVNSLKIFRESYLLYGNYPDQSVYMLQNFLNNHFFKLNYHYISAAAVIFAISLYFVVGLLFRAEAKRSADL